MGNFSKNFFKFLFARRFEDSISPTRETNGNCVRNGTKAPFFLQKGPSCKISHRDILQFTPENAPYGKEIPPIAMGGQGRCPLDPCDFLKKIE